MIFLRLNCFKGRLCELDGAGLQLTIRLVDLLHDADDRRLVAKDLILKTGLDLFAVFFLLKSLKCRQLDQGLCCLVTLHELEVSLAEAELDLLTSFWILRRLEVVSHAFELFLAHDPRLEDQLVAVELVLFLQLVVPTELGAF